MRSAAKGGLKGVTASGGVGVPIRCLLCLPLECHRCPFSRCNCRARCNATLGRWKEANRRVLGSLNDLAFQLQVGLLNFPDRPLMAHSLWLAKTPLKVFDYGAPDQATLAALGQSATVA